MNVDPMWILGTGVTLLSVGVGAYIRISDRVTKLETILSLVGSKVAKILHSPDDHLGMDALLDKYLDRHYELSPSEWTKLTALCEGVVVDRNKPRDLRLLAALLSAISEHKISEPPTERRSHDIS